MAFGSIRRQEAIMQYDLLICDGEIVDPGGGLNGRMDIGIAGGKIAAGAPALPRQEARATLSAKGRFVTPGLVDVHAHIFVNASDMGANTDRFCGAGGSRRCATRAAPARPILPGC